MTDVSEDVSYFMSFRPYQKDDKMKRSIKTIQGGGNAE